MDKDTKQESSIPVQSRVSIVTLASLDNYWQREGKDIRTVSQLVSWSLYLLTEILTTNGILGTEPSIEEARSYMIDRKLYQRGMDTRGYQKLGNAIRFQGMRAEGGSPQQSANPTDRMAYNTMHRAPNKFSGKPSSVEPFTGKINSSRATPEMVAFMDNLKSEDVKPLISQEFAMRNVEILDELTTMKQGDDMAGRFKTIEEQDQAQADALKNVDIAELMKGAKKEKSV